MTHPQVGATVQSDRRLHRERDRQRGRGGSSARSRSDRSDRHPHRKHTSSQQTSSYPEQSQSSPELEYTEPVRLGFGPRSHEEDEEDEEGEEEPEQSEDPALDQDQDESESPEEDEGGADSLPEGEERGPIVFRGRHPLAPRSRRSGVRSGSNSGSESGSDSGSGGGGGSGSNRRRKGGERYEVEDTGHTPQSDVRTQPHYGHPTHRYHPPPPPGEYQSSSRSHRSSRSVQYPHYQDPYHTHPHPQNQPYPPHPSQYPHLPQSYGLPPGQLLPGLDQIPYGYPGPDGRSLALGPPPSPAYPYPYPAHYPLPPPNGHPLQHPQHSHHPAFPPSSQIFTYPPPGTHPHTAHPLGGFHPDPNLLPAPYSGHRPSTFPGYPNGPPPPLTRTHPHHPYAQPHPHPYPNQKEQGYGHQAQNRPPPRTSRDRERERTEKLSFRHGPNVISSTDHPSKAGGGDGTAHPDIHPNRVNPFARTIDSPEDGRAACGGLPGGTDIVGNGHDHDNESGVRNGHKSKGKKGGDTTEGMYANAQAGPSRPMGSGVGIGMGMDSRGSSFSGSSNSEVVVPKVGAVRCYWAFLKPRYPDFPPSAYPSTTPLTSSTGSFPPSSASLGIPRGSKKFELEFVHLDPVLAVHMKKQKLSMIGRGVIEFIHPEEREQARKDLYDSTQVDNLEGSVTRVRFARLSRIRTILGCPPEEDDIPDDAHMYVEDDEYLALDLSIHWACTGLILGFFHAIRDIDPVRNNDPLQKDQDWSNYCGTSNVAEEDIEQMWNDTTSTIPYPDMDALFTAWEPRPPPSRVFLIHTTEDSPTRPNNVVFAWPPPRPRMPLEYGPMDEHGVRRGMPEQDIAQMDGKYWAEDYADLMKHVQLENKTGDDKDAWGAAGRTSCTRRFQGVHDLMNEGLYRRVDSYFIPYGNITFACFQTTSSMSLQPPEAVQATTRVAPIATSQPQLRFAPGQQQFEVMPQTQTLPLSAPSPPRDKANARASGSRPAQSSTPGAANGSWPAHKKIPMATRGRVVPTALPLDKKPPKEIKQAAEREHEKKSVRKSVSGRTQASDSPKRRGSTPEASLRKRSSRSTMDSPSGTAAPTSTSLSRSRKSSFPAGRYVPSHASPQDAAAPESPTGESASPQGSDDGLHSASLTTKRLNWDRDLQEEESDEEDDPAPDLPSITKRPRLDHGSFEGTPMQFLQAQTKAAKAKAKGKAGAGGGTRPKGGSKKKVKAGEPPAERIQIPPPDGIPCCINCHRKESPEWRKSENGLKELCNACGLKLARIAAKLDGRGRKSKTVPADDVNAELLELT